MGRRAEEDIQDEQEGLLPDNQIKAQLSQNMLQSSVSSRKGRPQFNSSLHNITGNSNNSQ